MVGAVARNLHTGSRRKFSLTISSQVGDGNAGSAQDDYGIDLHCTLTEAVGNERW